MSLEPLPPIIPGNPYNRPRYFPLGPFTTPTTQRKCPTCGFPEHGSLACGYTAQMWSRGQPKSSAAPPLETVTLKDVVVAEAMEKRGNKYHAERTWSELCQRTFASKAEAIRGEELAMLEKAGAITDLVYQPVFTLSEKPKVTYIADFSYVSPYGLTQFRTVIEDVKGTDTPNSRTKRAWVKQLYGIEVMLVRKGEANG